MSEPTELYKREDATECAREAVREQIVLPILARVSGRIVEVERRSAIESALVFHEDIHAYRRALTSPSDGADAQQVPSEKAAAGVWLFGAERVENPTVIYRRLAESLADGAILLAASEVPWPGKILSSEESAEYTAEETAAAFVRAGFADIDRMVEGPFFRIWKATKRDNGAHAALCNAEDYLGTGDFASAERELDGITEQMSSTLVVREFALLVAACHDLAGRQAACLDALSEALMLDPRCARAMCGLGRIAALTGDVDGASDFFDAALRCEPALVAGLHGKAVVLESKGDPEGAFAAMVTASDLRPKNDQLLSEAARLGNIIGKLDDVARFFSHRFSAPLRIKSEASDLEVTSASRSRN